MVDMTFFESGSLRILLLDLEPILITDCISILFLYFGHKHRRQKKKFNTCTTSSLVSTRRSVSHEKEALVSVQAPAENIL